jgi:hypothetical protein
MLVVEQNLPALKSGAVSVAMMFGILPVSHNVRVAKSQQELAPAMKMIVPHGLLASTAMKHQLVHHAHVVKTLRQLVLHAHIRTRLRLARLASTAMKHQLVHHVHDAMTSTLDRHAHVVKTLRQLARHAPSVMKFMHQSPACRARKHRLNA